MKTKAAPNKTLWFGSIPGIFGYGISVISETREGAMKALRVKHAEWMKVRDRAGLGPMENGRTVDDALEYFGGGVHEVELDRAYCDDFKE